MDDPIRYMYLGFRARKPITSPIIQTLENFYARPHNRIAEGMFEVQETFIRLLNEIIIADQFTGLLKECCIHHRNRRKNRCAEAGVRYRAVYR